MDKSAENQLNKFMADITFTKSELEVLGFYLKKAVIDAEGMKAIGMGSAATVDRLHSIQDKVNSAIKQIEERK